MHLLASLLLALSTPDGGSTLRAGDHRVLVVAHTIARDAARFCPATAPRTGMALHHLTDYSEATRNQMVRDFALDRGPGILAVAPDSAALRAGLQAGDVLLAVDDRPLTGDRRRIAESLEQHLGAGAARLDVLRGGDLHRLVLAPEAGCPMRARLANSRQRNAFADGHEVVMTTALLDFVESDDELAIILAHELAHNLLGHRTRLEEAGARRGLLRGAGRSGAAVRDAEAEADRLAVRLVWAAGYDLTAAAPMWRRYQQRFGGLQLFRTHPSLAEREANWNAAIAALSEEAALP